MQNLYKDLVNRVIKKSEERIVDKEVPQNGPVEVIETFSAKSPGGQSSTSFAAVEEL